MSDTNLRPLTLPSLSPTLTRLSQLKSTLSFLDQQLVQYDHLSLKLATFTDEPTWNAYIPFGELAFFKGNLIHTNDITQTITTPASTSDDLTETENATTLQSEQKSVLRSAKQATVEAQRLMKHTATEIERIKLEIEGVEAELKKERTEERRKGKKSAETSIAGFGEEEDWTVNERGEVINEDGLPIFDIREDLPEETSTEPIASTSTKPAEPMAKKPMRYLVKKGGKQVVRPLNTSSPTPSLPKPVPKPSQSATTPPQARTDEPVPSFPSHDAPRLDVRAILDELEAEEALERSETEKLEQQEQVKLIEADEAKEKEKESKPVSVDSTKQPEQQASRFGGFSSGFLSKSKQKRPSNSLVTPTSPPSKPSPLPPNSPPAAAAPLPQPVAQLQQQSSPLKSSLSRSNSRASSPTPKKSVVFDLPVPEDQVPTREGTPKIPKKQPIILGMGPTELQPEQEEEVKEQVKEKKKEEFVRPIKEMVVEKPLKKPTPPSAAVGAGKKKLSRFRKMKEDMVRGQGIEESKSKGKEKEIFPSSSSSQPSPSEPSAPSQNEDLPAPVHTISLSSKPSPSSSTSTPRNPDGTISYADIPFDSDEEEPPAPHLDPSADYIENEGESEDDDWYPSDEEEEEFDEEDFDVDSALHQREVALEYHRQRLGLAAGRGTGPLGGFHREDESPFQQVVAQQGLVPVDATLESLSSPLTHAAAHNKPSRFRTSNKHLESASLIIPSILSTDPSLTNSHTMLGPATPSTSLSQEGLEEEEEERMRRTLEALVEGRPLPRDEQLREQEKEIRLREEYAKRKELDRTSGKTPPSIGKGVVEREAVRIEVPMNPRRGEDESGGEVEDRGESVVEMGELEEEKPKKMSRFRMKQLGLLD
ncbi:hypothetical protein JCM5353_005742 [Sporobolomyces roseus]